MDTSRLTPFQFDMYLFHRMIDPGVDFALCNVQVEEKTEYIGGTSVRKPAKGGTTTREIKLTEHYVDLGLALERRDWVRAELEYLYLKRVLGWDS